MKPLDPDTFDAITDAVEDLGGTNLPEPCRPSLVPATAKVKAVSTTGCGRAHRMAVPYGVIGSDKFPRDEQVKRGAGLVLACAQDDLMELWPRIQKQMKEIA